MMKPINLCYHDLIIGDDPNASGFPTLSAATYKLDPVLFDEHIQAISRAGTGAAGGGVRLTFDDGGASSCRIADILEKHGVLGHFFIPTDYIGKAAFVNARQVLDLRRRGHIIGSHSCSHRGRMSSKTVDALMSEWSGSVAVLSDLLSERVTSASVPSGYYSERVAETAAAAGLELLFTLEPTTSVKMVRGCLVAGRYTMRKWHSADYAAAIASGAQAPRLRQQVVWNAKKALKAAPLYAEFRKIYFETRRRVWAG
jgi:peptidoglycan/xylan/chitin deacetylase (PgdA/CDA1 family)